MNAMLRPIVAALALLLALAGPAAALPGGCPECDEDGEPVQSHYGSIDAGAVAKRSHALADSDAAVSRLDDRKGSWAWISICLSTWIRELGGLLGVEIGLDGRAEAYASGSGVDLDLAAGGFDFDRSEVGHLDGETWKAAAKARAHARELGLPAPPRAEEPANPGSLLVDVCVRGGLSMGACP